MRAILDKWLGKWASRKLIVFLISTIAMFADKLDGNEWAYIAIAYIVIQGFVDAKTIVEKFNK